MARSAVVATKMPTGAEGDARASQAGLCERNDREGSSHTSGVWVGNGGVLDCRSYRVGTRVWFGWGKQRDPRENDEEHANLVIGHSQETRIVQQEDANAGCAVC